MKKIKLTQNKYALVDDGDFKWLNQWKWCANRDKNTFYAKRGKWNKKTRKITNFSLHRLITKCPKGKMVDHIDGNGLNNQRKNLRICTNVENCRNRQKNIRNTTGYKSIFWNKKTKKWMILMYINKKPIYLGLFTNIKKAIKVYNEAAEKYHKNFAFKNKMTTKSNLYARK